MPSNGKTILMAVGAMFAALAVLKIAAGKFPSTAGKVRAFIA